MLYLSFLPADFSIFHCWFLLTYIAVVTHAALIVADALKKSPLILLHLNKILKRVGTALEL